MYIIIFPKSVQKHIQSQPLLSYISAVSKLTHRLVNSASPQETRHPNNPHMQKKLY